VSAASGLPNGSVVSEAKQTPGDLLAVALGALAQICADPGESGAAKASAARTILDYLGVLGGAGADTDTRPVSEMSLAEIDAEIRALSGGSVQR
jgi:hypothetical protein